MLVVREDESSEKRGARIIERPRNGDPGSSRCKDAKFDDVERFQFNVKGFNECEYRGVRCCLLLFRPLAIGISLLVTMWTPDLGAYRSTTKRPHSAMSEVSAEGSSAISHVMPLSTTSTSA